MMGVGGPTLPAAINSHLRQLCVVETDINPAPPGMFLNSSRVWTDHKLGS